MFYFNVGPVLEEQLDDRLTSLIYCCLKCIAVLSTLNVDVGPVIEEQLDDRLISP
jgi:hypothetical protein